MRRSSHYNQFAQWWKWRMLRLAFFFASMFSFKGKAQRDVNRGNLDPTDNQTIYESEISQKFFEFYGTLSQSSISKQNIYLFLLFASALALVIRSFLTVGPQMYMYIMWGSIASAVMAVIGFILASLQNKKLEMPVSDDDYNKALNLLDNLSEKSRKPMPGIVKVFTVLLLAIDSAMIAIVAVDFMADLPRTWSIWGGILLGVAFAFALDMFNQRAGRSLFREHHRKELRNAINGEGGIGKSKMYDEIRSHVKAFSIEPLGFGARYGWMIGSIILMLAITAAAGYARYNQNSSIILEQFQSVVSGQEFQLLEDPTVPKMVIEAQEEAATDSNAEARQYAHRAMIAALVILGIVFITIQVVAMALGYKYSFYLRNGEDLEAYNDKEKYESDMMHGAVISSGDSEDKQMVSNVAENYLTKYFEILTNYANEAGKQELLEKLNSRGAVDFPTYAQNRLINKTGGA